ncbi:hypothetical protein SNE40_012853 [Patella caerulea]|uniref:Uncharacterized protein n=1 Tax=Patella caerulea TaxID=87958 RepID=A0AAN8JII7_PATCE
MSHVPFDLGFKSVTWNYPESGHGKGPADGVGAAIKTAADRLVVHGTDITNADELLDAMESQTTIKMSKIDPDRMDFFKQRLAKQTISSVKT